MKACYLHIQNFRGIEDGRVSFQPHTLLVGGNNVGKSTICEAMDLVLGPERLYRRPVIDEHDFYHGKYLDEDDSPLDVRIDLVLTDLTSEERRRFGDQHLRLWDNKTDSFIDEEAGGSELADAESVEWGLPVCFIGRYDKEEDDFVGETFFCHPEPVQDELDVDQIASLGGGRAVFRRTHKRLAGYVYLRALRTGSRALSLQRGSLLDTILQLGGEGSAEMWKDTLNHLSTLEPAIGDVPQLETVRELLRKRLGAFVNLAPGEHSAAFFASDLTRQHLREVVRLFVATQPSEHLVPYVRQGTGSINLLVFALLTIIADLKGSQSVIFAMEEPEIALPPHTQRRVTRYVLQQMGQSIVTSHSAPVIEQFEPESIVMLHRDGTKLAGAPIDLTKIKRKTYLTNRRQFAEAILARGVLVVEGSTEAVVFPAISSVLERVRAGYTHLDFAGVSMFACSGDGDVDRFGPIFTALGKKSYGACDKPNTAPSADVMANRAAFDHFWESAESGIEHVLVRGIPVEILRKFLDAVSARGDYPAAHPYNPAMSDDDVPALAFKVLKARKGEAFAYAAVLIEQCETEADLPPELITILITIDDELRAEPEEPIEPESASESTEGE
ncbi:AAA family ATPase [Mycobacterium sp. UM_CSW]|uniref:ATP-dependent nuclease n=1 Tax=Mycobacterium sp. UM_CSW TaxID=1370119 RepID=UPI00041903F7|nr:AAA family ATPase [Mycobacterium sp. UM_CSW]